jgi:NAD(P)-dependent dehydrogenase (short-subunit alcohol dehydrogenase family)
MLKSLKNKIVIVTGASEGIGRSIAVHVAAEGGRPILISRNSDTLDDVVKEIKDAGGQAVKYVCDIRNKKAVDSVVQSVIKDHGHIDVLINNAGIWQKLSQLDEIQDSMIDDIVATNLLGTIYMTKAVLPHLRANANHTAIINIVSKSGVLAQEGQSIYTAAKFGVKGFTDVLRIDLKSSNIHVGAVYQSGTNTDMFRKTGEAFDTEKFTDPNDLANAVVYMLTQADKMWMPEIHVNSK